MSLRAASTSRREPVFADTAQADDYVHRIGRRPPATGASFAGWPSDKKVGPDRKLTGKPIRVANRRSQANSIRAIAGPRAPRAELSKHSKRIGEKKQRFQKRDDDRPTASTEPLPHTEERSEPRTESRPEPRRERRVDEPRREPRNETPRQEKRAERPQPERRPPRDENNGPSVTGFGDNAPASYVPSKRRLRLGPAICLRTPPWGGRRIGNISAEI